MVLSGVQGPVRAGCSFRVACFGLLQFLFQCSFF